MEDWGSGSSPGWYIIRISLLAHEIFCSYLHSVRLYPTHSTSIRNYHTHSINHQEHSIEVKMSVPYSTTDHFEKGNHDYANGAALSRQMTVALTPEQYERLFFQPTQAKGDLAKRLGNPTLLGLLGFLVPFSSTMFCLLGFQGASAASLASISGSFYFFGGIAMVLAGICEFILGNTFPFVVFTIYGQHVHCNE